MDLFSGLALLASILAQTITEWQLAILANIINIRDIRPSFYILNLFFRALELFHADIYIKYFANLFL